MFRKPFKIVLIGLLAILAVACQPETVEVPVEVTRVVTEQVEGEVVEVTRVIENQIEVVSEVEVTRVIEVPPPDAPEGELIVAITTFPNAITPPNAAERQAANVTTQMFNGLVWRNEAGEIEPALATSWEISDDGTTYTFTLREGVVFHNGETFDAEDVVTTWEAGKDPLNAYYYTYEDVVAIEVIDDYTVAITSSAPDPLFLTTGFPTFGIYPTDYYNEVGFEGFAE